MEFSLLQALQLVRQLLQQPPANQPEDHASIARLTIRAAYAAVAVSEQAVCAALEALSCVHTPGADGCSSCWHPWGCCMSLPYGLPNGLVCL